MPYRAKNNPTAREVLAANMAHLKKRNDLSNRRIAEKAGISAGTVDKLCKTTGPSPQLDKIEPVAAALGLQAWQLLMPELPAMLGHSAEVSRLLEQYLSTDQKGREMLTGVAERVAKYKTE